MPTARFALPATLLVGAFIAMAQPSPRPDRATADAAADTSPMSVPGHDGRMRMWRISIGPGAGLPWRNGSPPIGGYLVKGQLLPPAAGAGRSVWPGDALADAPDTFRRGHAGPEGATALVYYANEA